MELKILSKLVNNRPEIGDVQTREVFCWWPRWDEKKEKFVWLTWIWQKRKREKFYDYEGYVCDVWRTKKQYKDTSGGWHFFRNHKLKPALKTIKYALKGADPEPGCGECWYYCKGHDQSG